MVTGTLLDRIPLHLAAMRVIASSVYSESADRRRHVIVAVDFLRTRVVRVFAVAASVVVRAGVPKISVCVFDWCEHWCAHNTL